MHRTTTSAPPFLERPDGPQSGCSISHRNVDRRSWLNDVMRRKLDGEERNRGTEAKIRSATPALVIVSCGL